MIDLTLDRLKRPAIKGAIYNFGTTVDVTNKNKGGLSTTEVDANMALQYELMREVNVSTSDETSIVEYNAKLAFVGDEVITLKMLNGSFTGCTVKITNRGSQTNRIEFNDNDALSVGPTQSYTLEWTGGNWYLGKEDADILKVTFTVEGDVAQVQEGKDIPCVSDVPIETIKEYAKTGVPIEAIIKVPMGGGNVVTYTCNNIATTTTSSSAGEMTQLVLSGWMYVEEQQVFLTLAVNSNDDIKLNTKTVDNTALDNTAKYTFIVDSNEKLNLWATQDSRYDYTSVLIRKGSWICDKEEINVEKAQTHIIEGEYGSKINCSITATSEMNPYEDIEISGVTIEFEGLKNSATGFSSVCNLSNCKVTINDAERNENGFYSCKNLSNCHAVVHKSIERRGMIQGFNGCQNVLNCTSNATGGMGLSAGFANCENVTNCIGYAECPVKITDNGLAYGFITCKKVENCIGTGIGGTTGYGFYQCNGVSRCATGDRHNSTSVFNTSYASQANSSTYACGDTGNGGFCVTTNPAATSITLYSELEGAEYNDTITPASGILQESDVTSKRGSITSTATISFYGDTGRDDVKQSVTYKTKGITNNRGAEIDLPLVIESSQSFHYGFEGQALLFLDNSSGSSVSVTKATGTIQDDGTGLVSLDDIKKVCPTANYFGEGVSYVVGITRDFNSRGSLKGKIMLNEGEPLPVGYDESMVVRVIPLPIEVDTIPITWKKSYPTSFMPAYSYFHFNAVYLVGE